MTMASTLIAGALGANVQGAAMAAQNETENNYLNHLQTDNLKASLKACAPGDAACINRTVSDYESVSRDQQQLARNCDSVTACANVKNDSLSGYGISVSDARTACQGEVTCVSFLTGLGKDAFNAKASATQRWGDVLNSTYVQNMQQALLDSGFSPTTAAVLAAATPEDAAGAAGSIWSSKRTATAVENAFDHWDKHSSEFPEYQNSLQYVKAAQEFVSNPPAGTLVKTRPNGDTLLYNPSTNTFAIKTIGGAPRTMFRPQDGMNYWSKQ